MSQGLLLSILIPTYNRRNELLRNINMLSEYLKELEYQNILEIIISDNCSEDDTVTTVEKYINTNEDIKIRLYKQPENLGLERNAVFVLSKSTAKHVMYLGDDDYLRLGYLKAVIEEIKSDNGITCIVPSILARNREGAVLGGRDIGMPRMRFNKGFRSVVALMDKGHQLSGLTFLREGTLDAYELGGLANIYLFMFFVGFNCMRGDSLHLTDYPTNVTEGAKKDWSYGNDGLLGDIFNNTLMLFKKHYMLRSIEETVILTRQSWRYTMYFKHGFKVGFLTYFRIVKLKNLSCLSKLVFAFLFWIRLLKHAPRKAFLLLSR